MDVTQIIARIEAIRINGKKPFRQIGGAADYYAAFNHSVVTPALFVYPTGERLIGAAWSNDPIQRFEVEFTVAIVEKNLRDKRGAAALANLEKLRRAVLDSFSQWLPDGFDEPLKNIGGDLKAFDDQEIWWEDRYLTVMYRNN